MSDGLSPLTVSDSREEGLERRLERADPAAFAAFFDFYFARVYAFAWRRLGDTDRAERLTERVLSEALGRIPTRPPGDPLGRWLFRILLRELQRVSVETRL
jgi:DNA-directed RNA polymerase specialized sigma24 family protein